MGTNKKVMEQSDIIYNRLKDEGIVGVAWCAMSDIPFDEGRFESFKYGFLLSDNEDALKDGLPHRHDLLGVYMQMESRFDNGFVELGRKAYEAYGHGTGTMCVPHCSTCAFYDDIGHQMYCEHFKRKITARKKPVQNTSR
jgi:hypothetical protein